MADTDAASPTAAAAPTRRISTTLIAPPAPAGVAAKGADGSEADVDSALAAVDPAALKAALVDVAIAAVAAADSSGAGPGATPKDDLQQEARRAAFSRLVASMRAAARMLGLQLVGPSAWGRRDDTLFEVISSGGA